MPEAKKAPVAAKAAPKKVTKVAAPKAKKEKAKVIPVSMTAKYVAGAYSPKAELNIASYAEVCKHLPGTYKELQDKLPEHGDFIGYLIRRGGLVEK